MQVEIFHKKKRDEKLHGARSEKELHQQLAAIERAARDAMAQDRGEFQGPMTKVDLFDIIRI
jgi:hypothetical protein